MELTVNLIQVILAILLIAVIIIQQKGAGLGSAFGGDMGMYRTRRGAEKLLFNLTLIIAALFILSAIVGLII